MDFSPSHLHVRDHALVFFFQAWYEEYQNTRGMRIRIILSRFCELARNVLRNDRQAVRNAIHNNQKAIIIPVPNDVDLDSGKQDVDLEDGLDSRNDCIEKCIISICIHQKHFRLKNVTAWFRVIGSGVILDIQSDQNN